MRARKRSIQCQAVGRVGLIRVASMPWLQCCGFSAAASVLRHQQRVFVPVEQAGKVAVEGHQVGGVAAGGHRDPGVSRGVAVQPACTAQLGKG